MDASADLFKFKWSRPETSEFPKIWKTFFAPDIRSKELVEYRIQDLPESRFEDAIKHMAANYLKDEPMTFALNGSNDEQHRADYTLGWRSVLAQKTVLVCFKAGSDEIVGVNFNFVNSQEDNFFKNFVDRCVSNITKTVFDVISLMYRSFDPFKHYGVNNYLGSLGLSVDRKYRGRGVGVQLLDASFQEVLKTHPDWPISQTLSKELTVKSLLI
ncbi:uncharacterized protein LOC119082720 isoform X2 [Bradysia coprophila]|uniref:uncharacterized protein LOC119082720 isoform X2 n=1 Tax=Bradysia coprophila TaxID=38358 RepID=UPI00187D8B72|nr:uncharacterized protein LOC119082720 isoform X2 [Bradysia coprophila]